MDPINDWKYVGFSSLPWLRGAEYPYLHGVMLVQIPKLISKIPHFDEGSHYIAYGDFLKSIEEENIYINISDLVIFIGDPDDSESNTKWITKPKALLSIYEGETVFKSTKTDKNIIFDDNLSYGGGSLIADNNETEMNFFAPRTGFHRISSRVCSAGVISIFLDDDQIDTVSNLDDEYFYWSESDPIYLERGYHNLLYITSESAMIDQILILSIRNPNITLEEVLFSKPVSVNWNEISPSEYDVSLTSDGPSFLVLGEAFHGDWNGFENGKKVAHFRAQPLGWANGFYLESGGDKKIKIKFLRNDIRKKSIFLWEMTWVSLICALIIVNSRWKGSVDRLP